MPVEEYTESVDELLGSYFVSNGVIAEALAVPDASWCLEI